jgi:protein-S-isoprenylcysteine O-methyltransferase Ste14
MHSISSWQMELIPWYAFLIVWAVAALRVKTTKATESYENRIMYGILIVGGFYLLFSNAAPVGWLNHRFMPLKHSVWGAGIVITWAGTALAIWARFIIGENWSANVTRKVGHELIKRGPYAYVRHPIYSGLTLAMIGTALVVGEWRGLLGVALAVAGQALKAKKEEQFMLAEFGVRYEEYRRDTGFLLPGL